MCLLSAEIKEITIPKAQAKIGWRAWRVRDNKLYPTAYPHLHTWCKGQAQADIVPTVTGAGYTSGLHVNNMRVQVGKGYDAIGKVKFWGKCVQHGNGYRAQFAEVVEIYLVSQQFNTRAMDTPYIFQRQVNRKTYTLSAAMHTQQRKLKRGVDATVQAVRKVLMERLKGQLDSIRVQTASEIAAVKKASREKIAKLKAGRAAADRMALSKSVAAFSTSYKGAKVAILE